jgi:hypothetical protein
LLGSLEIVEDYVRPAPPLSIHVDDHAADPSSSNGDFMTADYGARLRFQPPPTRSG